MTENKNITAYKLGLKERIVDMAMTAFAAKGIKAVKMDDIAQQLGISKRTLYELYDNKEDLLYEGVRRHRACKDSEIQGLMNSDSNVMDIILHIYKEKIESFRMVTPQFFIDIVKYPRVLAMLEADKTVNHQRFLDFLRRGVSEGYFRDDVNYELIAVMFDAIGDFVMSKQLFINYGMETVLRTLVFTSLRGFCTMRGVKVLDEFKL